MKKQFFVLALAAAVLFTACGQKADTKRNDEKQETAEALEQSEKDEDASLEAASLENQAVQAEMPKQDGMDSEFSKGLVSENGWESQWLNMRFTAPEGTRMASEEALAEWMGISEELLAEDLSDTQIQYADLASVQEMMCYDELTKANVIVSVDKLPLKMPEEAYAEQLERSLAAVSAMKYKKADEDEMVEISGISYLRSAYQVETMGQSLQTDYYIRMIDSRVVSVIVTYGEDGKEAAASMINSFETYF